jgi:pectin methylesterase-like acyl-CoA thioesterase
MKKTALALIVIVAVTLVFSAAALAVTRCVNPGGTGGCSNSIQAAVTASSPGDVINVYEGRYNENVVVTTNNLTIQGVSASLIVYKGATPRITVADPTKVIVDAYQTCIGDEGFDVSANNFTLKNMTVRLA